MKLSIYMIFLLVLSSSMGFAKSKMSLQNMAGTYKIYSNKQVSHLESGMSVEYKLAISPNKDVFGDHIVGLNEVYKQAMLNGNQIVLSEIKCKGVASLEEDKVINISVRCDNSSSFEQKITFNDNLELSEKKLSVSVFSSLSGLESDMIIERIN